MLLRNRPLTDPFFFLDSAIGITVDFSRGIADQPQQMRRGHGRRSWAEALSQMTLRFDNLITSKVSVGIPVHTGKYAEGFLF